MWNRIIIVHRNQADLVPLHVETNVFSVQSSNICALIFTSIFLVLKVKSKFQLFFLLFLYVVK